MISRICDRTHLQKRNLAEFAGTGPTGTLPRHCERLCRFVQIFPPVSIYDIFISTGDQSKMDPEFEVGIRGEFQTFNRFFIPRENRGRCMGKVAFVIVLHGGGAHDHIPNRKAFSQGACGAHAKNEIPRTTRIDQVQGLSRKLNLTVPALRNRHPQVRDVICLKPTSRNGL